jgi:hypothetical protein
MEQGTKFNYLYLMKNCLAAAFTLYYLGLEIGSILHMKSQMILRNNPELSVFLYISTIFVSLTLGSLSVRPLTPTLGRRHLLVLSISCVLSGSLIVSSRQIMIGNPVSFFIAKIATCYGCGVGSATAPIFSTL